MFFLLNADTDLRSVGPVQATACRAAAPSAPQPRAVCARLWLATDHAQFVEVANRFATGAQLQRSPPQPCDSDLHDTRPSPHVFHSMSTRLPPIDIGALRSSPALIRSNSSGSSVRQHPYAYGQRRFPGTTTPVAPSTCATPVPPRSQSLNPPGHGGTAEHSVIGENGRWSSSHDAAFNPTLPGSAGQSSSSPATPLNGRSTAELDSIDVRFPSFSTVQTSWDASMGHDVAGLATNDPSGVLLPHELESLISMFHLDAQRNMVRDFSKMSTDQKLVVLFMQQLRLENQIGALGGDITALEPRFAHIEQCTALAWQPSKAQMLCTQKLCRSFVRHYLAKPLSSYVNIGNLVRYIRKNAERMRLRIYCEDMTARVTLNHYIDDQCSQLKSAFRKSIFKSCKNKIPLASFGRNVLNNYHIPIVPEEVPIPVLGTLALLREIADPLSKKKNLKGADTGFWTTVEEHLKKLYNDLETKGRVTDEKWLEWAREMIKKDAAKFPIREVPDDEHGFEEPDPGDAYDDDDLDIDQIASNGGEHSRSEDDYDGDVALDGMGDIGSTA
ncbi:hypothetical protein BN946_scf184687.g13 [Trametes cinnabarina]|uniref:Uncharacterized protein n=1 Tax=Pycnoporus cinnabarinus TaxID=5643 RepID=A0A060SBG6_PYCCI|nr:hypothetical protein BN946_scf184687.g13 [Trametes cinnabarina]